MRRALLTVLALTAFAPVPAGAACTGVTDAADDATIADDMVLSGSLDQAVPLPALDIRSARAVVTKSGTEFTVRVTDLALLSAEAPTGASFSWLAMSRDDRNVQVTAYVTPQRSGVGVLAFRTGEAATIVADYPATVLDVAADTVRFVVPAKHLGWLRPGVRIRSVVGTDRFAGVHDGTRMVRQGAGADSATAAFGPWGAARC